MSYNTKLYFNNSGNQVDIGGVFCDLTNNQTIAGKKQFSNDVSLNGNVTVNTAGTTFVVTGNVTLGNLNATTNMYINGSAVATQSYVTTSINNLNIGNYATLASPTFTGTPQAPTPGTADNGTTIATTAFVKSQGYATLASPTFTGTPQAPTPGTADNGTTIATTAFVKSQGYITGVTGFMSTTANQTISGNNTFTGLQSFGSINCSNEIGMGSGFHVWGGNVTFDTGFAVTGGTISMSSNPKLTAKNTPNVNFLGGRDLGGDYGATQYSMVDGTWVKIATVNVVAGWFLFVVYIGLGMASGTGGNFYFNFGISSSTAGVNIASQSYYDNISFGNGATYPIHSASFVIEFSEQKPIYLLALLSGVSSMAPAGDMKCYGSLTAIRLS